MHEILASVPLPLAAAWSAALGAAVGSFLNVVVARLPRGESLLRPGSRCPRCRAPIAWYDNVPVLSWILLAGRCRACRAPISFRYPLVEALGALAALLAFRRHGLSTPAAAELAFASVLLALTFIDLDTWLLPHALTWPLLACGVTAAAAGLSPASLPASLWGAGLGFAAFAAVAWAGARVFGKEALGFGDVWLLAGIGAWLGARALLPVVLLASLQGSLVGIALILLGKATPGPREPSPSGRGQPDSTEATRGEGARPSETPDWVPPKNAVPFGPFLALGALEWLWLGGALARWVPALDVFR
ncbi:MAG TPA: prepilin peptidase [Anaeromyxobacteraceae bacterium]|nr:prepilin peptidase [Anaeromyxobacteraceae bacterium]